MTIQQKKKRSQSKKRIRHSSRQRDQLYKLNRKLNIWVCKNCMSKKLWHRVCKVCGFYAGKQVLNIKSKSKGTVVDA